MKFKHLIFLFIFFTSCTASSFKIDNKISYSSSGFAYIYSENDYKDKIINKKFDNNEFQVGHNRLKVGTFIKITNPNNNKSLKLAVTKRVKYPDFYQVLITESLSENLELNKKIPLIEIAEINKNKSFVAGQVVISSAESTVHNTAPVTNVKIDNLSKIKTPIKRNVQKFSIILANFYSKESAITLKNSITKKLIKFDKKLKIKKIGQNDYELFTGPYNTVNSLKNDYIDLRSYGIEELEIKIYDKI